MAPSGRRTMATVAATSAGAVEAKFRFSTSTTKSLPAILGGRKRKKGGEVAAASRTNDSSSSPTSSSSNGMDCDDENAPGEVPTAVARVPLQHGAPPASVRLPLSAASHDNRINVRNGSRQQQDDAEQVSQSKQPLDLTHHPPAEQTPSASQQPAAKKLKLRQSWSEFRSFILTSSSVFADDPSLRRGDSPFPALRWADRQEMWDLMCKKETGMYLRKSGEQMLQRHPSLEPRMRAILFDWLVEVCEVYRLHRETYYLAVDFVDRYLSRTRDVHKSQLQLIGVSCLFVSAKIEEIYPPKVAEFAYVTDGACSEEGILGMELVVIKELNWGLSPMTPNAWVKLYLQVLTVGWQRRTPLDKSEAFVNPQYSGQPFSRVMNLLDLATLDLGSCSFTYSVLAATALALVHGQDKAVAASGYAWEGRLSACAKWMLPFAIALSEETRSGRPLPRPLPGDDHHDIQTHVVDLALLERAQQREVAMQRSSPDLSSNPTVTSVDVTPPEMEGDVNFAQTAAATRPPFQTSTSPATAVGGVLSPQLTPS